MRLTLEGKASQMNIYTDIFKILAICRPNLIERTIYFKEGLVRATMEVGKISESILKRAVLKQISQKQDEVIIGPGLGQDFSAIEIGQDETAILSTKSVTGTYKGMEVIVVNSVANKVATSGGQIIGILITVILPPATYESELEKIINDIETTCGKINIDILAVDCEVSEAVNAPVITVTGVGKCPKDNIINGEDILPDHDIVMTKWAGLEGSFIISNKKETDLLERFTKDFVNKAKGLISHISVLKEANIASQIGVGAMHTMNEGGVFAALWEVAEAASLGLEVDINKIPIKQETIEICEAFDMNPYEINSTGSLLIVTDKGNSLVSKFEKDNIKATVIGRMTKGNDKVVVNGDYKRYLTPPHNDELYKI